MADGSGTNDNVTDTSARPGFAPTADDLLMLDPASLLMSVVHMTGDLGVLRGPVTRRHVPVVEQGQPAADGELLVSGFTQKDAAWIRARAVKAIEEYRAGGSRPAPLDDAATHEMLAFLTGREIDDSFAAFIAEELALDGTDTRRVPFEDAALRTRTARFPVVVIGAGLGGLLAAIRLKEAGIPFRIVEKNAKVGGTWFENKYPGCRVDVAGHSYSYSFEPNFGWSRYFPQAPEIREYFERCVERYDLRDAISFETSVVEARWDEANGEWSVDLTGPGGAETVRAAAIISAVGQLNMPRMPDIPGLDDFAGPVIHSARWPDDVTLDGKRIAVLGTGASALQIVPELARIAGRLHVFARSAAWMFPNPIYHEAVPESKRRALEELPFYQNWFRFILFYTYTEGAFGETLADPEWKEAGSVSQANQRLRKSLTAWIESQVTDPDLLPKLIPDYPPFGKRILQDNGSYLAALQKDNVTLQTARIERITTGGIVTADGEEHAVDAIVCATGFKAEQFLFPIRIIGRDGITLADQWQSDDARAYLGITVPNFPNLFCVYGPNTNLAQAGSIVFNAESQMRYIMQAIRAVLARDAAAIEVRADVHDAYNDEVDRANAGTAWGHDGVRNWYKNSRGRVTANLPFRTIDYWARTRTLDPQDFTFSER